MGMERAKQCCNEQNYKEFMLSSAGPLLCVLNPVHEHEPLGARPRKHKGAGALPGIRFPRAWLALVECCFAASHPGWERGGEQQCTVLQAEPLHNSLRRKQILSYFSYWTAFWWFCLALPQHQELAEPSTSKSSFFMNATEWAFYKVKFDLRLLICWMESLYNEWHYMKRTILFSHWSEIRIGVSAIFLSTVALI